MKRHSLTAWLVMCLFGLAGASLCWASTVTIKNERLEKKAYQGNCDISIDYPQIVAGIHSQTIEQINQTLKKAFFSGDEVLECDKDTINHCLVDFEVKLQRPPLFSLVMNGEYFTGGAHPSHDRRGFTFDLDQGRMFQFKDLFLPGFKKTLDSMVKKKLAQSAWANNEFETLRDDQEYVLTERFLVILFAEYEIVPYSEGMPHVEIPYRDLVSILNPSGPVSALAR